MIPVLQTNATYTHNIKYPSGSMNPLDRKVVTRNLCIDTLFRRNHNTSSATNFLHILPEPITNVVSMNITAIEFPNAWYTFASENYSNQFTITVYNAPTPTSKQIDDPTFQYSETNRHTILIPDGNYRSDLLATTINNLFTNAEYGLEYLYFDINEINTHCIFRTKTDADGNINAELVNDSIPRNFYFTIDFSVEADPGRPLYKNAGWMLGFKKVFYTAPFIEAGIVNYGNFNTPQQYNWYIESESSYGSGVHNYVFLEIDDFNKNFSTNTLFSNTANETYLGNNIMGRISVVSGMNTIVTNTSSDCVFKKREYFGPVKLEKIHIRLLNKFGDPVLLNENDFSFVLEIEQLYS